MTSVLDLHQLRPGQIFTTAAAQVTRELIVAYAAEHDPQPAHLDEEAARNTPFGELVASGWHTASLTYRLLQESLISRIPDATMEPDIGQLAWPRPVRPGDTLHVVAEVAGTPEDGAVQFRATTLNQHGQTVQSMLLTLRA